eukprot:Em0001g2809a
MVNPALGADVNSPSADAGPDPCVSNHDVLPVVPVVPDVPVSTEAMMPCTACRGNPRSTHSAVSTTGRGSAQSMYCQQLKENTRPNMAFHPFLFTNTPVTMPLIFTSIPVTTPVTFTSHAGHHVHHAGHVHVTGVVTGVLVNVTGVVTGVNFPDNH